MSGEAHTTENGRRRRPGALVVLVLATSQASAQQGLSISGYVADFPAYQHARASIASPETAERDQYFNIARVRLRPVYSFSPEGFLAMEYEVTALVHSGSLSLQDGPPTPDGQLVPLRWTLVDENHWQVVHFIDRLFYRQEFGTAELTVGRQRIAWGTGRIWNPTDLFNPIHPVNYAKIEKDGVDAALGKLFLGSFSDISVVCNPEYHWRSTNAAARIRTNVREFDLSLMVGLFRSRGVLGGDFAGNLFTAGVRGEGLYSWSSAEPDSQFFSFILGADYQFTPDLYGLVEYYRNGEGSADPASYDLEALAGGRVLSLGRDIVALRASWLVHPLLSLTGSLTISLNDGSQFYALALAYSASDELSVTCGTQLFAADPFDEYWYFPQTLYFHADFFF